MATANATQGKGCFRQNKTRPTIKAVAQKVFTKYMPQPSCNAAQLRSIYPIALPQETRCKHQQNQNQSLGPYQDGLNNYPSHPQPCSEDRQLEYKASPLWPTIYD